MQLIPSLEKQISSSSELSYFWTHQERYKYILEKILKIKENLSAKTIKALDIGCYPYHLGKIMEDLKFEVYGISSSHEPIKDNPRIKILNIETDIFPYPDNFFDLILFTEVIEHLLRSPLGVFKEIKRVLKPDGRVILTTPNVLRSINRFSLLFGRNIYPLNKDYYDEKTGDTSFYQRHNKEYTLKELTEIAKNSGFKILKKEYFISYTPFRKRLIPDNIIFRIGKIANYLLMLLFPALQDTIYLEMKK